MTATILNPVLMDVPMPVTTPRLLIRPMMPGDGVAVTEAKRETWDDLTRWMEWAKGTPDPDADEIVMRQSYADFILRKNLNMVAIDRGTNRMAVFTGLHRMDWHAGIFEIGYWSRTSARGHGYTTEAANALTRYAFGALNARRVIITHAEGNEASAAVIRRLGYPLQTVNRFASTLPDGRVVDSHMYNRFDTDGLPDLDVRW